MDRGARGRRLGRETEGVRGARKRLLVMEARQGRRGSQIRVAAVGRRRASRACPWLPALRQAGTLRKCGKIAPSVERVQVRKLMQKRTGIGRIEEAGFDIRPGAAHQGGFMKSELWWLHDAEAEGGKAARRFLRLGFGGLLEAYSPCGACRCR